VKRLTQPPVSPIAARFQSLSIATSRLPHGLPVNSPRDFQTEAVPKHRLTSIAPDSLPRSEIGGRRLESTRMLKFGRIRRRRQEPRYIARNHPVLVEDCCGGRMCKAIRGCSAPWARQSSSISSSRIGPEPRRAS